jgi:hypothetical protein
MGMAADEEEALGHLFRLLMLDEGARDEFARRAGWHPAEDPLVIWARAEHAPLSPWMLDWPEPPPALAGLVALVSSHAQRLETILDEHGWPGRRLVGRDGADAAWFVAMHADRTPDLQRRCIALLHDAVASGDADPRHLATLVDRVASETRGLQQYGTLALVDGDDVVFLVPVEDGDGLDARRDAIGLPLLEDDLEDDAGRGQLPYRHLRQSPGYAWPHERSG